MKQSSKQVNQKYGLENDDEFILLGCYAFGSLISVACAISATGVWNNLFWFFGIVLCIVAFFQYKYLNELQQ